MVLSDIRLTYLFLATLVLRLSLNPFDLVILMPEQTSYRLSLLAPVVAFVLTYAVLTWKRSRAPTQSRDGLAVALLFASASLLPLSVVPMLFMLTLVLLGWLMHIRGRYY